VHAEYISDDVLLFSISYETERTIHEQIEKSIGIGSPWYVTGTWVGGRWLALRVLVQALGGVWSDIGMIRWLERGRFTLAGRSGAVEYVWRNGHYCLGIDIAWYHGLKRANVEFVGDGQSTSSAAKRDLLFVFAIMRAVDSTRPG
jgi:hypothetical protein